MNKKMMLVALIALGFSSLTYSSVDTKEIGEEVIKQKPELSAKIVEFLKATPAWSIWLPATLLKCIPYFKNMGPWTGRAFSVVVWAAVGYAIKKACDKYQERKKRSKMDKGLHDILRKFDETQLAAEQSEIVDVIDAEVEEADEAIS